MAIVRFERKWHGEVSGRNISGERTFTELFQAISDNGESDDAQAVEAHPGCPREGDTQFRGGTTYYARQVEVSRATTSRIEFMVRVQWSNRVSQEDLQGGDVPPIERAARYEWDSATYTRALWRDRRGYTILNTAGDPPDPVPEVEEGYASVTVMKNVLACPPWVMRVNWTINSAPFVVDGIAVPKGSGRIERVAIGDYQQWGPIIYRPLTFTIGLREPDDEIAGTVYDGQSLSAVTREGWDLTHLNEGLYENVQNGPIQTLGRRRITDSAGNEVVAPFALKINGEKDLDVTTETAVHLRWQRYRYFDFNLLPLA
jgi:hypothetical protein